ncbi:MAG TPA: phosphoribosylamine--glycine ligase [Longimicrobiales bacterium]|nr:phosphoribosylamine--glycine ligase [Longimicrobiales bacterium]
MGSPDAPLPYLPAMRILIVGNGGREHALLWKLRRDAPSAEFFATQPNGGMAPLCSGVPIAASDVEALAGWAAAERIDLTVVGPEAPLAAGLVDRLEARGLPVFGPSRAAARIESSKAWAKELMRNAGVPTAAHRTFSDQAAAEAYVRERGAPIVVKASGLAAGKGAVVCGTVDEAVEAIASMLGDLAFGEAGREVVVEDFMEGEEISVFALADGAHTVLLLPAQDHKRVGEGDSGPNTGGMGAYAPVAIATPQIISEACLRVFDPVLRAMADDGSTFRGLLYAGLMKTTEGLKVVEFNCRFGDPETQAVLPLMESSLLDLMRTVAEGGSISGQTARFGDGAAVTTVVASAGYPGTYERGKPVHIPAGLDGGGTTVFHAGTALDGNRLVTSGGRVLAVTAVGSSFTEAAERSRQGAAAVSFEGAFFRSDIGWREQSRLEG